MTVPASRRCDDVRVGAAETDAPERADVRPGRGRQHGLSEAEPQQQPHLFESLEGGRARVRDLSEVTSAREITAAEPSVVVRGPDQTVEVELAQSP